MVTLVEELPFAFAVDTAFLHTTCSFCFTHGETVHKCAACYNISYCNRECQKSDWVNHKKECGHLKKWMITNSVAPDANSRLTCRILLKSEEELAQVAFNGRTWECLMDHAADAKLTNDQYSKYFEEQVAVIKLFLKPTKDVRQEEAEKALSRVLTNVFCPLDKQSGGHSMGRAIYLGLSVHNHSCFPDAHFVSMGNKGVLRSVDPNTVYSPKLNISYLPRTPFRMDRKSSLKGLYHFDCECPLCTDVEFIMNRMGISCYVGCCKDAAGLPSKSSPRIFKCNKCDKASTMNEQLVFTAHARICKFLDESWKYSDDNRSFIIDGMDLLQRCKMWLSLYNVCMLDLGAAIRKAAMEEENFEVLERVSNDLEKAYDYYLPVEDITRNECKMAKAFLTVDEQRNARIGKFLEETRLIYGDDHPFTKKIKEMSEKCAEEPTSAPRR